MAKIDLSAVRELAPFLKDGGLPAGCAGKSGYLLLGFELDPEGRSIMREWERHAPLIVQQALYFDEAMPEMPCVYILSSGGPNVDGDRYEQRFRMKRGSYAHISTGAATKLAEMHRNCSTLDQRFELAEDSYLEYLPEPMIPCRHTRFVSDTDMVVAPSATLFYSEIYMCGRKYYGTGERYVYDLLSVALRVMRSDNKPLYKEHFVVSPADRSPLSIGQMNGGDVLGTAVVVTPPDKADAIWERVPSFCDSQSGVSAGLLRLPSECGLSYRVIGRESGEVRQAMREFCSVVRSVVKGKPLPPEFPWR